MFMKSRILITIFTLAVVSQAFAQDPVNASLQSPLVLTGKISSANKQIVTAPKTDRWQIQIQWLAEEGQVVEQGDLVAVFDGSLIQSQLELNRERLETETLELTQKTMDLEQKLLEAQGALEVANLEVEKARIEASVPDGQVSDFDKGKYQLTLKRSLMEQSKAQEKLALAEEALRTGVQKQRIEIKKIEEDIAFGERQLENMSVQAQFRGPVTYANHPWSGDKLAAGLNVQAAWNILDVQATDSYQIESYVHEIDAHKIGQQPEVNLVLDAYPDKVFQGQLEVMSTQAEKQPQWSDSVYYPVIFRFEQTPQVKLLPGMSVRVEVVNQAKEGS